jgi:ATP-dependent RNA helicase DDX54/DBP10
MAESGTELSSDEDELREAREAVRDHNRKKKKSGGFQSMGLSHAVLKGVLRKGYKVPTPIQRKCIPLVMDGRDVVAMARTGSGKTAAFLLPLFERLKTHSSKVGARGLVLSPTRELALQTMKFTKELGKFTDLRTVLVVGGDSMEEQFSAIHGNPDVIVGTPGRFLHLVVEMELRLDLVEYVVFDEADRLFELGFAEQLHEILRRLPESKQTLLFSATLPKMLVEFATAGLKDPVLVRLDVDSKLSQQLKMSFFSVREDNKASLLLHVMRSVVKASEMTVVFAATKHHLEYIKELLNHAGIDSTLIYSTLDPVARKINAAKFSTRKVNTLLVTDIAARGIDIPMLDNVINYNFPATSKLFVHRVGRVARAGRSGTAYSFVSPDEAPYLLDLHLFLGRTLRLASRSDEGTGEDCLLGTVPQRIIDEEDEYVRHVLDTCPDIENMKRVSENGLKQYTKSRPSPSADSVRRAKDLPSLIPYHPIFAKSLSAGESNQLTMIEGIKSYKPAQTIFEVSLKPGSSAVQVMQQKRSLHGNIVTKEREKQVVPKESSLSTANSVGEVDEEGLQVFVSHSKWQTELNQSKKKGKKTQAKDENYISYLPDDIYGEKGLSIGGSGFGQQASEAVLDLTGDDEDGFKKKKSLTKWDRKRKKFIGESQDPNRKKVKTEMGTWIRSTYKSNMYKDWMSKTKTDRVQVGTQEDRQSTQQHSSHNQLGKKKWGRWWHTKTAGSSKMGNSGRLRSKEEIVKLRKKKEKMKFKNLPRNKRRQILKQRQSHFSQGGRGGERRERGGVKRGKGGGSRTAGKKH